MLENSQTYHRVPLKINGHRLFKLDRAETCDRNSKDPGFNHLFPPVSENHWYNVHASPW